MSDDLKDFAEFAAKHLRVESVDGSLRGRFLSPELTQALTNGDRVVVVGVPHHGSTVSHQHATRLARAFGLHEQPEEFSPDEVADLCERTLGNLPSHRMLHFARKRDEDTP